VRYVFREDLRRAVIFDRNNLVKDAPISRVDSLVRRNMLMYPNAETPRNVLGRLHFALAPTERLIAFPARCVRTNNNTSIGAAQRG
jgi:two-component system CheB/CheR fusion protein